MKQQQFEKLGISLMITGGSNKSRFAIIDVYAI